MMDEIGRRDIISFQVGSSVDILEYIFKRQVYRRFVQYCRKVTQSCWWCLYEREPFRFLVFNLLVEIFPGMS